MTAEPKQRPGERGVHPQAGAPGPDPATTEPERDTVYDSAEAAMVAERLEALGYIE